jgi:membrane protease YdiL (CAAX protease family)
MSIVAVTEAPTALSIALFAGMALLVGIPLARWGGVFQRSNVIGPARWELGDRLGGLFLVAGIGLFVWYAGQMMVITQRIARAGPTTQPMNVLTVEDWATLATIPGLLALAVLVGGNLLLGRGVIDRLGYGLRELWNAPWPAIIGTVIFVPFLFATSSVAELIYQLVGYEHPEAHDMLLKMRESPGGWGRWGLLMGAVVVAPLFEEMLFRGHLQTLLAAFFDRFANRSKARAEGVPAAGIDPGKASGFPVIGVEQEEAIPYAARDTVAWPRWAAIITTAILFTAVHAAWTAPPIFLLALAMGYAYERTGNLWVSIMMHAMFNGLSTAIYLNLTP